MRRVDIVQTDRGFTLIEVLIALLLFVATATGVAQLCAVATRAARTSREHGTAVMLAAAKMDQLRALDWAYAFGPPGDPPVLRTDITTNVSVPALRADGPGLQPSPAGSLTTNMPPYVDYLDREGRWVGNGSDPPRTAVFIRRWSVRPAGPDGYRTLAIHVLVTTVAQERSRAGPWQGRTGTEVVLTSFRTRKVG
jgi:prepilin-type N-terminal cleavage/methylation domain-containing protein